MDALFSNAMPAANLPNDLSSLSNNNNLPKASFVEAQQLLNPMTPPNVNIMKLIESNLLLGSHLIFQSMRFQAEEKLRDDITKRLLETFVPKGQTQQRSLLKNQPTIPDAQTAPNPVQFQSPLAPYLSPDMMLNLLKLNPPPLQLNHALLTSPPPLASAFSPIKPDVTKIDSSSANRANAEGSQSPDEKEPLKLSIASLLHTKEETDETRSNADANDDVNPAMSGSLNTASTWEHSRNPTDIQHSYFNEEKIAFLLRAHQKLASEFPTSRETQHKQHLSETNIFTSFLKDSPTPFSLPSTSPDQLQRLPRKRRASDLVSPSFVHSTAKSPRLVLDNREYATTENFMLTDGRSKAKQLPSYEIFQPDASGGSLRRNRYTCAKCGKSYATSSNLSRHKQTHRSIDGEQARPCPHCDKVYVSMPALSMHILTHDLKHKCDICGKRFSRPWLLQGHLRSHTGEKPYGCAHCGKAFADRSNLRAHIQTHSIAKNYICGCGKPFALKAYLTKHRESGCSVGTSISPIESLSPSSIFSTTPLPSN